MALVIYDEVKLNTSGARATGLPGSPPKVKDRTLHDSVYRVYAKEDSDATKKVYRVSVNKAKAPHWFLIEYGSSRAPAHPYLRPAFDRVGAAIVAGNKRMAEVLKR